MSRFNQHQWQSDFDRIAEHFRETGKTQVLMTGSAWGKSTMCAKVAEHLGLRHILFTSMLSTEAGERVLIEYISDGERIQLQKVFGVLAGCGVSAKDALICVVSNCVQPADDYSIVLAR